MECIVQQKSKRDGYVLWSCMPVLLKLRMTYARNSHPRFVTITQCINCIIYLLLMPACARVRNMPLERELLCDLPPIIEQPLSLPPLIVNWDDISITGDGTSTSDPVKINGTRNRRLGVAAERYWVESHFGGYKWLEQRLEASGDGHYLDILTLCDPHGNVTNVVFDVTEFYGGHTDFGVWRFFELENGSEFGGNIHDIIHLPYEGSAPWHPFIDDKTGTLVVQCQTDPFSRHIYKVDIVAGVEDGAATMWRMGADNTGDVQIFAYRRGLRDGVEINYSIPDATVFSRLNWKDGRLDGRATYWCSNGLPVSVVHYVNGDLHGMSVTWDAYPHIAYVTTYTNNVPVYRGVREEVGVGPENSR